MEGLKKELHDIIEDCATGLFESYGLSVQPESSGDPSGMGMAGIIGFTHAKMRGTLIIAATEEILESTRGTGSESRGRDWVAELANQLLGRIKNKLVARGVELDMTTPLAIRGQHLSMAFEDEQLISVPMRSEDHPIRVWFDFDAADDLTLQANGAAADVASEGDMLLF